MGSLAAASCLSCVLSIVGQEKYIYMFIHISLDCHSRSLWLDFARATAGACSNGRPTATGSSAKRQGFYEMDLSHDGYISPQALCCDSQEDEDDPTEGGRQGMCEQSKAHVDFNRQHNHPDHGAE